MSIRLIHPVTSLIYPMTSLIYPMTSLIYPMTSRTRVKQYQPENVPANKDLRTPPV